MQVPNQEIRSPLLKAKQVSLTIKREDTIHPFISGNKFRKLKYNLKAAKVAGHDTLLTFGGAFSNHIAATAYAGRQEGLKTIGVIRGEELETTWQTNPTLRFAHEQGMRFHFVTRQEYRLKGSAVFLGDVQEKFGKFYLLPEGGTNTLAVKGCEEILTKADKEFDVICSCVGTGGTLAGLINSKGKNQTVLGFPVLKGDFLREDIRSFATDDAWQLKVDYHFGGYAKVTGPLIDFINDFKRRTRVPLEPVYTGKLLFGIMDLVAKGYFKEGTKILAIHSGGLQGIAGMNQKLKKKNLPIIDV